ncbi:MAG: O-antigen ligase family protein, partial [Solirubrobacteraceae bacterium]
LGSARGNELARAALTVEAFVEGAASLGAAGAAGAALLVDAPRARARTMVAALLLAGVALSPLVADRVSDQVSSRPAVAGAGVLLGLLVLAGLVVLVRRRPMAFGLLVFAALPFRVPLTIGGSTANLLIPLYVVTIAGCLAYAFGADRLPDRDPPAAVRRLDQVLAGVLVLYALQAVYASDVEQAVKNICFFYVPFALLYRLLREVAWSRELLLRCLYVVVGLALFFAAIGFVEFATGHLLIPNSKVLSANEIKPYFRVNSLFFDPNIYGRFLALAMIALAARLLWSERARDNVLIAVALAVLWAGLVLSLSQSSFAALLVGLAVLAALRWKVWPVIAVALAGMAVGVGVALISPETINLKGKGSSAIDAATSGRADLVTGGAEMFADRPVWGYGSGGFEDAYRERENVRSTRIAAVSHTIPVTVAAEQGVIGLIGYVLLLVAAFAMVFGGGLREAVRARPPPALDLARIAVAAAFAALVAHTLVYASFLEDPLTWVLLGLAAALRQLASSASLATEASSS